MQCKLYVIRVVVNDMKYYCFRAENSATESSLSAFYFREFSVETWSVESLICTNVKVRRKILYLSHMSTKCSWKKYSSSILLTSSKLCRFVWNSTGFWKRDNHFQVASFWNEQCGVRVYTPVSWFHAELSGEIWFERKL